MRLLLLAAVFSICVSSAHAADKTPTDERLVDCLSVVTAAQVIDKQLAKKASNPRVDSVVMESVDNSAVLLELELYRRHAALWDATVKKNVLTIADGFTVEGGKLAALNLSMRVIKCGPTILSILDDRSPYPQQRAPSR